MRKQLMLNLNGGNWGGRREGAGRKRRHSPGVAHRRRERVSPITPLHVNFKFRTNVRNKERLRLLKRAIVNARRHGLRVLHYSFQHNHIHLILEAASNEVLSRGMRSLTITFAKGVRAGKIQLERYHLHVLRGLRETRNAIHYVLFNQQRHEKGRCSEINDYSSVLSLECGRKLVQDFARRRRITLKLGPHSPWDPDPAKSFLGRDGLQRLFCEEVTRSGPGPWCRSLRPA